MAVATMALVAASLSGCSSSHPDAKQLQAQAQQSLTCSDSVGQQGQGGETVVGGVEGLVLPGSDDPSALYPVKAGDGRRYYVYKAFLAVSPSAAPYATVSVISPASAKLVYGSSSRVGDITTAAGEQALIAAARSEVRLPVCGSRFTGFAGGIIVTGPACVTFKVSSPAVRAATVSVPIGPSACALRAAP
jgi:hypothetical protein